VACCAFAVFLLGQLLAALAWLRGLLPRPLRGASSGDAAVDPVTAWRLLPATPGLLAPAPAARALPRRLRRSLLLAVGLELAILGVGALGLSASRSHPRPGRAPGLVEAGVTSFWCRSLLAPVVAPSDR